MSFAYCHKLAKTAVIVYAARRWNVIPTRYSKLSYILVLSPTMLAHLICHPDLISYKYRRFLISLTYPESIFKKELILYDSCKEFHPEQSCIDAFKTNWKRTLNAVFKIYVRFYLVAFLFSILWNKKRTNLRTHGKSCALNCVKSTAFLVSQTLLQRALLCYASNQDDLRAIEDRKKLIWFLSMCGSTPVMFERDSRVKQVNSLVLAHLYVGALKKYQLLDWHVVGLLGLLTVIRDKFSLLPDTLIISILTSAVF